MDSPNFVDTRLHGHRMGCPVAGLPAWSRMRVLRGLHSGQLPGLGTTASTWSGSVTPDTDRRFSA